jgi:DNA-binding HxlR family transcriptional regulator
MGSTGMYRYTLKFAARSLDESRVRDVLEQEFGLSAVAIIRDGPDTPAPTGELLLAAPEPRNEVESLLRGCFADGKPWRRKALIQRVSGTAPLQAIASGLMRLERSAAIRKIRHGVFISADAPEGADAEIPPMNMKKKNFPGKGRIRRPSYDKLFAMLNKPRSAGELREALGVSRQRIDQMLKTLMREDKLRRFEVTGERGNFVYVLPEFYDQDDLSTRSPILRGPRDRLLSALSPDSLCRAAELSLIALSSNAMLVDHLEQLSALRLITKFTLGHHTYVGITSRGITHPQYDRAAPKCRPADLLADFGEARVKFVQNLQVLGSARTVDLTYAMPKGYFDGKPQGSGQIIQALERAGIVQKVEAGSRRPRYSLTDKGRFLSGVFARVSSPAFWKDLRESIAERKQENSERRRRIGLSKISRELPIGSPNQAAIVHALGQAGRSLTTMQILKMGIKFNHPRSIHLALHALEGRGVIRLVGIGPNKAKIWDLSTEKSLTPVDAPTVERIPSV